MHRPIATKLDLRAVLFVVILTTSAIGGRLDAAAAVSLGTELMVNSDPSGSQQYPSVALHDSGSFVVTWGDFGGHDGSGRGVFARRFDSAGLAIGGEFQVNSYTEGAQDLPAVSVAASGDFVIAWVGYGGQDGSDNGVFAQRFDSAGVAQATELQVNTYTTGHQATVALAMEDAGDFVIVWTSFQTDQDGSAGGIFGQRFDASGSPQSNEFQVNAYTSGDQEIGRVASDADGDFVVVWTNHGQDGSGRGVFARRFDSTGAPQASELQVNSYTAGDQDVPAVSLDDDGDAVIVWGLYNPDRLQARRFSSSGDPAGAEFQVNVDALDLMYAGPRSISLDDDGDFVVTWSAQGGDASEFGVRRREFDASGFPLTTELQVNTYTTSTQRGAAVSIDSTGDFVVVWHGVHEDDTDGGVFAQRFRSPAVLDVDGDGSIDPLTDAMLVMRDLFGFTGEVLVDGAVNLDGCLRCTAIEIGEYLDSLK